MLRYSSSEIPIIPTENTVFDGKRYLAFTLQEKYFYVVEEQHPAKAHNTLFIKLEKFNRALFVTALAIVFIGVIAFGVSMVSAGGVTVISVRTSTSLVKTVLKSAPSKFVQKKASEVGSAFWKGCLILICTVTVALGICFLYSNGLGLLYILEPGTALVLEHQVQKFGFK